MQKKRAGFLIIVLSAWLISCATSPNTQDYAGSWDGDISKVENATPKYETVSRQGNSSPYTVLGKTYYLVPYRDNFKQTGIASWYGKKFHGRLTSNGEVYDMYKMTAAHKTLPIPSYVKVNNLENGKSIIVRINDRGPFHEGRVIDLSFVAAKKLGIVKKGTASVSVESITPFGNSSPISKNDPNKQDLDVGKFEGRVKNLVKKTSILKAKKNEEQIYLQAGAYASRESAASLGEKIRSLFGPAGKDIDVLITEDSKLSLFRIRLGPISSAESSIDLSNMIYQAFSIKPFMVVE